MKATILSSLLLLTLGAGCALESGEAGELEGAGASPSTLQTIASVEQALPSHILGPYKQYGAGTFPINLPSPDWVCALAKVQGHFEGYGERVRVYYGADNLWKLEVTTKQDGVAASAYCFNSHAVQANGDARWVSPEFKEEILTWGDSCVQCNPLPTWWGNAVTFLTGISGDWDGGGEWARVTQTTSATSPSYLTVAGCNETHAWAHSFFAGTPAQYAGDPAAVPAKFWRTYEHSLNVPSNGVYYANLAPTSEAMCMLTQIKGSFQGGGEYVQLYPKLVDNVEVWRFSASKGSASSGLSAKARCYLFDQR